MSVEGTEIYDRHTNTWNFQVSTENLLEGMTGRTLDIVMEDDVLQQAAHVVACRQLGLDPTRVVVGGNQNDADKLAKEGKWCLQDGTEQEDKYWNYAGAFWVKILAAAAMRSTINLRY